ncbi:MAG: hypothetical protein WCD79_03125 [Chthoniobacteraceae bacterium]
MKTAIPALVALCVFATACLADDRPRTIVTRDHQTYEKAVIVDHNDVSVTISYDAGVVRVAVGNLPADIQRELGYASKIPDAPQPTPLPVIAKTAPLPATSPAIAIASPSDATAPPTASPPTPPTAAKSTSTPPAPIVAKPFTQAEANALYGVKKSSILKKWGAPVKIEQFTDLSKRQVTVLVYDEDPALGTKFWIYDKEGFVSGGVCKGRTIHNAAKQAKLDSVQAVKN